MSNPNFGDTYCGPGYTMAFQPSGPPDCIPDATTSPVAPPINWDDVLTPPPGPQPAPQGSNNPAHPVGVPLNPPPAAALAGSNTTMLLLLGAGALLLLTMGGKGRR